jgi:hypothetical protein
VVGCGFGVFDIERDDVAQLGRGLFDVVTCRLVYAFLDQPRFLATARYLLAPAGILHVTTPHNDRLPEELLARGIGAGDEAIDQLREGWASSDRYDIDHLTCIVCRNE